MLLHVLVFRRMFFVSFRGQTCLKGFFHLPFSGFNMVSLPETLKYDLCPLLFHAIKQCNRLIAKSDIIVHNVKCCVEASRGCQIRLFIVFLVV